MKHTQLMTNTLFLATAGMASAVTLQLDLGGTNGVYAGTDAPAGITDSSWNGVGTGATATTGLLYGDGTMATGVSVETGRSATNGPTVIDWSIGAASSRNNAAGDPVTGIYDTLLTSSWFFGTNNQNIGVRVTGLAPGEYDVYAIAREPTEFTRTYDVGIGVGTTTAPVGLLADTAVTTTSLGDATGSTTWIDGQNFALQRVTVVNESDWVTVISDPTNERFATLSGLQIVSVPAPIPEPSSIALLGLGLAGYMGRRRR